MHANQNQIYFALFFAACVFFFYEGFNAVMEDYKEKKYWRVLRILLGILLIFIAGLDFYEILETMEH